MDPPCKRIMPMPTHQWDLDIQQARTTTRLANQAAGVGGSGISIWGPPLACLGQCGSWTLPGCRDPPWWPRPAWRPPATLSPTPTVGRGARPEHWGDAEVQVGETLPTGRATPHARPAGQSQDRTRSHPGAWELGWSYGPFSPAGALMPIPKPRGDRKPRFDHAAARWYSWTTPPRRSRRRTSRGLAGIGSPAAASGEARPRARCGRCRL